MQDGPKFLLVALYWIIRAYVGLIFVWAIMSWIPGLAGSQLHNIIGMPILPVVNIFSFLHVGQVGLGAVVVALLLGFVANWLAKFIVQPGAGEGPPMIDGADQHTAQSRD
jgi:YggT family protein